MLNIITFPSISLCCTSITRASRDSKCNCIWLPSHFIHMLHVGAIAKKQAELSAKTEALSHEVGTSDLHQEAHQQLREVTARREEWRLKEKETPQSTTCMHVYLWTYYHRCLSVECMF